MRSTLTRLYLSNCLSALNGTGSTTLCALCATLEIKTARHMMFTVVGPT